MKVNRVLEADPLIEIALREDIGDGDVTTSSIIDKPFRVTAHLVAKDEFIVAGVDVFHWVYQKLDADVTFVKNIEDGNRVSQGSIMGTIGGDVAVILKGERVALNFLQRLSGIATLTRAFVTKVTPYPVKILDTRKTTPGWRALEKYAVKIGGGDNHRLGLFDAVLIKDNHIRAAGGIGEAVRRVKSRAPHHVAIEVETRDLQEVKDALDSGVNTIMLDNMSTDMMKEAVAMVNKRVLVEASGNIRLDNIEAIAATGVDFISVGALTHSAKAVDISLKIVEHA